LNTAPIYNQHSTSLLKRIAPGTVNIYNPHREKSLPLHTDPKKRGFLTLLLLGVALELLLDLEFSAGENF
jgi:hypothetical protein